MHPHPQHRRAEGLNAVSRLKGIETNSPPQMLHGVFVSLNAVSRLKGIETERWVSPSYLAWAVSLNAVSRLKGIETNSPPQMLHGVFVSLNAVSRLKGIETERWVSPSYLAWAVSLNAVSRLKGIETNSPPQMLHGVFVSLNAVSRLKGIETLCRLRHLRRPEWV